MKKVFLEIPQNYLRKFTKFTGKHWCQSLFLNKVAGLRPATLLKNRFWLRCFPVNFVKFLRIPFLTEHLLWLLLENLQFIEHNIAISFCPSRCLLRFVLPLHFSMADVFSSWIQCSAKF